MHCSSIFNYQVSIHGLQVAIVNVVQVGRAVVGSTFVVQVLLPQKC